MKINKNNISEEDKKQAISILNALRSGQRVFGNPAQGLKITLKKLQEQLNTTSGNILSWELVDSELIANIAMLNAGIQGEEQLAQYLSTLLKNSDKLDGVIAFASLSYEQESNDKDYIPDSDFLIIFGRNVLVLDAKNIKTNPDVPITLEDGVIVTVDKGKEILAVHQSTHIWENVLAEMNISIDSIDGYVVIVNKTGATVERNDEWQMSHTKVIHISELYNELLIWKQWCEQQGSDVADLNMLTQIAKAQVREEKSDLDLNAMKRQFGV